MSGPKISYYELTDSEKRNFDAQIKCGSEALLCFNNIKSKLKSIKSLLSKIEICENCGSDEMVKMMFDMKKDVENCQKLHAEIAKEIEDSLNISNIISMKIIIGEYELKRKQILLEKLKENKIKLDSLKHETEKLLEKSQQIKQIITEDARKCLDNTFEMSVEFPESADIDAANNDKIEISNILENMKLQANLSTELVQKLDEAKKNVQQIENLEFLSNFKSVTVSQLISECKKYLMDFEEYGDKYKELLEKYVLVCSLTGKTVRDFKFSPENCKELEIEIGSLEKELIENKEKEYIADAIDDVMSDMGYDLIGSRNVTKKSGKRFKDELYTFSEGTAVNIRYDNQGKISMELGGIDTSNRVPDEMETDKLCEDMVLFCDGFSEIEKRLLKKGIVCKNRIVHLPPSVENAQIINIEDYNMNKDVSAINIHRSQSKSETKKQLRSE